MTIIQTQKGVTLAELLITLAIFSIMLSAVYSVYTEIMHHVTIERKGTKTELDLIAIVWPLMKEIQTAGFGTGNIGSCTPGIRLVNNILSIHSSASGDHKNAGTWSYLGEDCVVSSISEGGKVALINAASRDYIGMGSVSGGKISPCHPEYYEDAATIAYWVPGTSLACYETSYALRPYAAKTRPVLCEQKTWKISRSVSKVSGRTHFQPILDCVYGRDKQGDQGFNVRFGCIESTGNVFWKTSTDCGTSRLKFIRFGILVQSSPKTHIQGPASMTLFEELDPSLRIRIDFSDEQRYFRWKKLEQTVPLMNLA